MPVTKEPGTLSRRYFLKVSGLTGTALCLGFYFPAGAKQAKIVSAVPDATEVELNAWIRIDAAGKVTIMSHRAEMGQGAALSCFERASSPGSESDVFQRRRQP